MESRWGATNIQWFAGGARSRARKLIAGATAADPPNTVPLTTTQITQLYNFPGNSAAGPNPDVIAPEGYTLDAAMIARPGNMDIQLDLFLDYATT